MYVIVYIEKMRVTNPTQEGKVHCPPKPLHGLHGMRRPPQWGRGWLNYVFIDATITDKMSGSQVGSFTQFLNRYVEKMFTMGQ